MDIVSKSDAIRRVYELLRQRGGMKKKELARELHYSPKTSTEIILMSLEHAGCLVYQEEDGTVKALD